MPLLGREPGTEVFRELGEHPGDEEFPGVVVMRLDGGLFFATADALEDRVREIAQDATRPARRRAGLRGRRLHRLPGVGEDGRASSTSPTSRASTLRLARIKAAGPGGARARTACSKRIGADQVHAGVSLAVEAQLQAQDGR